MFGLLKRDVPSIGSVYFRGSLPPRAEEFTYLKAYGVEVTRDDKAGGDAYWSLHLRHKKWGEAEVVALRSMPIYPPELIDWSPSLSDEEKQEAKAAGIGISVSVASTRKNVLADRKRLLRYLSWLMGDDGLVAADHGSELFWSRGMLEDELCHDADLDVEALYCIHAVSDDIDEVTTVTNGKDDDGGEPRVSWLHTHGLAAVGAFDFDVIAPSPHLIASPDPIRSIAFAILEGSVQPNTPHFHIAQPGGHFKSLFGELEEFGLPCVVKLGYPVAGARDESDREHLWFEVHAIGEDGIDATLMNQPHAVPTMNEGDRGVHSPELLSGWTIMTPLGPITPEHMRAAREIRQDKARFREFMALMAKAGGAEE